MLYKTVDCIVTFIQIVVSGLKRVKLHSVCVNWYLPLNIIHQSQKTTGIDYEFIKEREHVVELWALARLLLPAVQHQLVQRHRAAHRCW